jgi:tripartite-type tricarboxylate transporter receptor subunit TctC
MTLGRTLIVPVAAACIFVALQQNAVAAKKYPDRPIDLIIPWGAGGGVDRMTRAIAPELSKALGVPTPAQNVTGGKGNAGLIKLNSMPADGYATAVVVSEQTVQDVLGLTKVQIKDFAPVARLERLPNFFWVTTDSPFKTVQDLIDTARKREVTMGVTMHKSTEGADIDAFNKHFGTKLKKVSYPKFGKKSAAFLGKHVEALLEQSGDMNTFREAGKVRPLVFLGPKRLDSFPDTPATGEMGMTQSFPKNFFWLVKKGTPQDRIDVLEAAFKKANDSEAFRTFLKQNALDYAWAGQAELKKIIDEEYLNYGKLVKDFGWDK